MKAIIHRGAREIGGICVELEFQGQQLVLDIGCPLDAALDDDVPLPPSSRTRAATTTPSRRR